jgi:hypothetical protein
VTGGNLGSYEKTFSRWLSHHLHHQRLDAITKNIREAEVATLIFERSLLGSSITEFFETRNL